MPRGALLFVPLLTGCYSATLDVELKAPVAAPGSQAVRVMVNARVGEPVFETELGAAPRTERFALHLLPRQSGQRVTLYFEHCADAGCDGEPTSSEVVTLVDPFGEETRCVQISLPAAGSTSPPTLGVCSTGEPAPPLGQGGG